MTHVYLAMREFPYEGANVLGVFATAQGAMERCLADIRDRLPDAVPDVPDDPADFEYDGCWEWNVETWRLEP